MAYKMNPIDEHFRIAQSKELNVRLYAQLAKIPLYVNAQLIAPGYVGKRSSFRLGWIVGAQRLANNRDRFLLPDNLVAWVAAEMAREYPDHMTASGLSDAEVLMLEQEQKEKRAKYQK